METGFDLESDDFGTTEERLVSGETAVIVEKKYAPWHKPRKQWVREKQWWAAIKNHILDHHLTSSVPQTLRYFGLPGEELLDVRHLHKRLGIHGGAISVFGLNNVPDSWKLAQEQLSRMLDTQNFCKTSCVERYGFNDLQSTNATLFGKIKRSGPFDVVNLDFCDSVISPCIENTRLLALKNIVDYQLQFHASPWLLFITTRSSRASSSEEAFRCLHGLINKNLSEQDFLCEFENTFNDLVGNCNVNGKKMLLDPAQLNGDAYSKMLVVGLLKWIFQFLAPKCCSAKLTSIVCYDIEGDKSSSDMVSLCIRFKKEISPTSDNSGLTPIQTTSSNLNFSEPVLAARALNKVASMQSVDDILSRDIDLYREMTKQKMELLEEAGKSADDYLEEVCAVDLRRFGLNSDEFKKSFD